MRPPFSRRLDWERPQNALAVAESHRRRTGDGLLDLTSSNPTEVGLPDSGLALGRALGRAKVGRYAPSPRGSETARRHVADTYARASTPIDPERLVLTASSSESYSFLFKLLCDPGDVVLVPEPSYPLFDYLARLEGVVTRPYRLSYEGAWSIDLPSIDAALENAATATRAKVTRSEAASATSPPNRIAALIVVSPNNPTGSVLRAEDLAALDRRCADADIALIADEVFSDFVENPSPTHVRCVAARPTRALTFSLGGLSKSCGMPQLKLGWIAVGGPATAAEAALTRLDLVADTYLSVGTPVQEALPDLLLLGATIRASIIARVAENRRILDGAIGPNSPLTVLKSDGGWSAIIRVPAIRTDEEWAVLLLQEDGVLVQPGYFFDFRGATVLVVSLLPACEIFAEGVRRLVARVDVLRASGYASAGDGTLGESA